MGVLKLNTETFSKSPYRTIIKSKNKLEKNKISPPTQGPILQHVAIFLPVLKAFLDWPKDIQ